MQQDRVDAGKKPLEGDKKHRDDMQDNETVRKQATERRYYISSLPLDVELFAGQ